MTTDDDDHKRADDDKRHRYGPRPLGAVLPMLTKAAFRRRGAAAALIADWPIVMGPAIAAITTPRRLAAGTLSIGCSGPVAMELQHVSDQVIARINTHLGSQSVQRIKLVQEASRIPPHETQGADPISDFARESAAAAVATLPAGGLRDSLRQLGEHILSRAEAPPARRE